MQTASAPFDPDSKIKCLVRSPHYNDRTTITARSKRREEAQQLFRWLSAPAKWQ